MMKRRGRDPADDAGRANIAEFHARHALAPEDNQVGEREGRQTGKPVEDRADILLKVRRIRSR